ncbi:hypothetical protein [Okeania sp. SIO1I7]|nr:hypothetical protein [Okeania sp. SIO1I7]
MKREIIVHFTPDRQLKIPAEIQQQLTPGDRYKITMTEDSL